MSFFESFDLFLWTYVAGLLVAAALSISGLWLIARDQIFAGAGFSQASVLGAATGIFFAEYLQLSENVEATLIYTMTVLFSVGAAFVIEILSVKRVRSITAESVIGFIFIFASAFSVLVVVRTTHGVKEITSMLSSSVLGLGMADSVVFLVILAVSILLAIFRYRSLISVCIDPAFAASCGVPVRTIQLIGSLYIGLIAGLSIRYSGMLYTFAFLVMPGLFLKPLLTSPVRLLLFAPVYGIVSAFIGFWTAHVLDLPLAQTAVAIVTTPVLLVLLYSYIRR